MIFSSKAQDLPLIFKISFTASEALQETVNEARVLFKDLDEVSRKSAERFIIP